ncbi:MAG: hypothetical protein V1926_00060 [Candidatus Peregrinibacteria bacterium]
MTVEQTIVGHETERQELERDLEAGNVSHAYLFAGPSHLGKMTIAKWFAMQLLAHGASPEEREHIVSEAERLVHSDFLVLDRLWVEGVSEDWAVIGQTSNVPQQHRMKKPVAKTDTIGIDDIRALQQRLYETKVGAFRCCIIRLVERMQDTAANAFLKILEEPPEGLVFLLTTSAFRSLLPTVISRTRVISFRRVPSRSLRPLLTDLSEDDASFVLHLSQGAPGIALRLRNNPDLLRAERLLHSRAQSFWRTSSLRERLQLLEPLHKRGEEADQFLLHLFLTLRECPPAECAAHQPQLMEMAHGFTTNTHRELLSERFVLSVSGGA